MRRPKFEVGQVVSVVGQATAVVAGQSVTIPRGSLVEIVAINTTARRVRYQVDYASAWLDESALTEASS